MSIVEENVSKRIRQIGEFSGGMMLILYQKKYFDIGKKI